MKRDFTTPARLAAILIASVCVPCSAQEEKQPPVKATAKADPLVTFRVIGMQKTKSGAT